MNLHIGFIKRNPTIRLSYVCSLLRHLLGRHVCVTIMRQVLRPSGAVIFTTLGGRLQKKRKVLWHLLMEEMEETDELMVEVAVNGTEEDDVVQWCTMTAGG
ncbi:uncharacterized [Tachysurus ichikawai]